MVEYGWQQPDVASRADIRVAIEKCRSAAVHLSALQRGATATPRQPSRGRATWTPRRGHATSTRPGAISSVQLPEGQIQAIGGSGADGGGAGHAGDPQRPDGDGYFEQFTIGPFATTVTDPAQLAVYVPASARFDGPDWSSAVGARRRIEPVTIRISGGFATITGARWLLVPPRRYQGLISIASGLDPDDATTALTTLDVYQRTTNGDGLLTSNAQATITWDTHPWDAWAGAAAACGASDPYGGSRSTPAPPRTP